MLAGWRSGVVQSRLSCTAPYRTALHCTALHCSERGPLHAQRAPAVLPTRAFELPIWVEVAADADPEVEANPGATRPIRRGVVVTQNPVKHGDVAVGHGERLKVCRSWSSLNHERGLGCSK